VELPRQAVLLGGMGQCTCSEAGRTLSLRRPCPISSVCGCQSPQARLYPNSHVLPGIYRMYRHAFGESGAECDLEQVMINAASGADSVKEFRGRLLLLLLLQTLIFRVALSH